MVRAWYSVPLMLSRGFRAYYVKGIGVGSYPVLVKIGAAGLSWLRVQRLRG